MPDAQPTTKPRYFRLLEKGEAIKEGDCWLEKKPNYITETTLGGMGYTVEATDCPMLRPVQVDEWVSYAERKPTKEDFELTGYVAILQKNEYPMHVKESWFEFDTKPERLFWRKVTPPEKPKPKSVDMLLEMSNSSQFMTLRADGSVKLKCGTEISAESIDAFINARQEVTNE